MARPRLPLETWGNITVTKRNGQHVARARFRDIDGKTRQAERTGKTETAARNRLTQYLRHRLIADSENLAPTSTVTHAVTQWLQDNPRATSTQRTYDGYLKRHIQPGFGEIALHEVTPARANRFIQQLAERSGADAARGTRALLSNALARAVQFGAIPSNPIPATAVPKANRKTSTHPETLSAEDIANVQALFDAYDNRPHAQIKIRDTADLYAVTAARTGELLALDFEQIDFDAHPVTIRFDRTLIVDTGGKLIVQMHRKGNKDLTVTLGPTATAILMQRRINAYNGIVFPSATGTYQWPNNFRRALREALKGSPYEWVTPRVYRKTLASVVDAELGAEAARDQLGHARQSTTETHYIKRSQTAPDTSEITDRLIAPKNESVG